MPAPVIDDELWALDLKQEFGPGHFEGRGWRGFHHHASLCIAAYGFLSHSASMKAVKKTPKFTMHRPYPRTISRAAPQRMQQHVPDSIATLRWGIAAHISRRLQRYPYYCVTPQRFVTQ